jgi:6-phosphofructokinase 1
MGRDAGHIALKLVQGGEILIPEEDLGLDGAGSLQKSKASGKSSSIVVIAEGDKIGKTYLN